MIIFYNFFQIVWRIWFTILVFLGLVFFFPFLWVLLLNKKWYYIFHYICKIWSRFILFASGFSIEVQIEEKLDKSKAYIICPNHVSYIDIPVTFAAIPGVFVFVGKKSLSRIPLFGWFYKNTMILVDRSNNRSSYNAYKNASEHIINGVGIAIYPEGGIPPFETKLNRFKSGAFRMSIEQGVNIVPVTFLDNKSKFPCGSLAGKPGKLRVCIHKPIDSSSYNSDSLQKYKNDVYAIINNKLTYHESK